MSMSRTALRTSYALMGALLAFAATAGGCSDSEGSGSGISKGENIAIEVTPNPVAFATVEVGGHDARVVTVRHSGTSGTLKLKKLTLKSESTEFTLVQPEAYELQPGQTTTFTIEYDPVDQTLDSGVVEIETNVATETGAQVVQVPIETLAQGTTLRIAPDPIDFGDVESGQSKPLAVSVINFGADTVKVTQVKVSPGADHDFSLTSEVALGSYGPAESFALEVTYSPTNGGADSGKLEVSFESGGQAKTVSALLIGREVGPQLVPFPNPIDFGWRPIDVPSDQPLNISNQGGKPLRITGISMSPGSSDTVEVVGVPAGETVLNPGTDVLPLTVRFTPRSDMIQTTGPIATLLVASNDTQNEGPFPIMVFGRAEAPLLQVNPPSSLDFGFVAQNLTTQRTVSLYNAGSAPLTVTSIELVDNATSEFALVEDGSWGPLAASPTSGTLAAGAYKEVRVTFKNTGGSTGSQFGGLVIHSNDGQKPDWRVDLKASRAGAPTCKVTLTPSQLDYGTVPRGFKKTLIMHLVNTGSGDCSFHSVLINDCVGFFGAAFGSCDDPVNTQQISGTSKYYKATSYPPAIQGGLKAGQSYDIEVTFTPPDTAPIFGDDLVDYAALLAVRVVDPYSGTTTPVIYPPPTTGGLSPYTPNLHAKSGVAKFAVLPQEVAFGVTTIGCHSQTTTVTGYNIGSAPLDVTDVQLVGCSPEFRLKSGPGLPLTLNPNGSDEWKVVYIPQDLGDDSCTLAFYTDSDTPTVVVPLSGAGTYDTEQTDTFVQTAGQMVDVLFVVDNSGSMSEEQSNLSSNFRTFIQAASQWSTDYHIAVTSTDMTTDVGRLLGTPKYVTSANWQAFEQNVRLGTNGDGIEKGLAAAQAALSLPNTSDSSIACTTDEGCAPPDRCQAGFCGGPNRGFLRQDATLEVVFVSDEDDFSPADLNFYINFFKNIKGFYNDELFHAHAIVGPQGGCRSSYGDATAGLRYIDVANQTGGQVGSICDQSFAASLSSIGNVAFGLRKQFFLSRLADPSTITVKVNNTACQSQGGAAWRYDAPSNAVIFNEGGACMPQVGQSIEIRYASLCLLE